MTPTREAYRFLAVEWSQRGKQFLGAAVLLHQRVGSTYVVAHLIAQGVELLGKSYLLWVDPDITCSKLRRIGHDLVKLNDRLAPHLGEHWAQQGRSSLSELDELFKRHALRYADLNEFILAPPNIPDCSVILKHLKVLLRLAVRYRVWQFEM